MNDKLYKTSDTPFAAYLCMRGYTLLGAIDNGSFRHELCLTTVEDVRPDQMHLDILQKQDEFRALFQHPHDTDGRRVGFEDYWIKIKMCTRAVKNPIREEDLLNDY